MNCYLKDTRPERVKILVSCSLRSPFASGKLSSVLTDFFENCAKAVQAFDVDLIFAEASQPRTSSHGALVDVDGVIILGGADADPELYGQSTRAGTNYGINPDADRFELELIAGATARGVPLLGICRGMQLINIFHGGDLVQEIGVGSMHYSSSDNTSLISHEVTLEPQSHLARIYGGRSLTIRSGHHQAVDRLGAGLRVAATAADGIVEALEGLGGSWVVGVQWHPEDPQALPEDLALLLGSFIAQASYLKKARANLAIAI